MGASRDAKGESLKASSLETGGVHTSDGAAKKAERASTGRRRSDCRQATDDGGTTAPAWEEAEAVIHARRATSLSAIGLTMSGECKTEWRVKPGEDSGAPPHDEAEVGSTESLLDAHRATSLLEQGLTKS